MLNTAKYKLPDSMQ